MVTLSKSDALFARDEKGELIAQEVELVIDEDDEKESRLKGQKIFIVPLTRGEIRKMFSDLAMVDKDDDTDNDGELILKYCKNPEFTKDEIKHLKGYIASTIVNTILFHSGIDTRKKTKKQALKEKEDEFGKNSEGQKQIVKKEI